MRLTDLSRWLTRARRTDPIEEPLHETAPANESSCIQAAVHPEPADWPPIRLELVETLWGDGCLSPGGSDEVLRLAAPLGLSAATSLLLLGAGSGGAAVRLASELGVWLCACEADPNVLAAAARRVQRAGGVPAKRVTLQAWHANATSFRRASFHHAISIESLHGELEQGDCGEIGIAGVRQALRPGGQLVVLETVAGPAFDPSDPSLRAWCRLEHRPPPRANGQWPGEALQRLGCDIRVAEDASARQMLLAVTGWKRLVRELRVNRPPPARAAALVSEAELWLRRVALLRGGQLRLMRWHAIAR